MISLRRYATELDEQRSECANDTCMRDTIGRDQPVTVLDFRRIVSNRVAEKIAEGAACFLKNYLWGACVPLLGTRRQVHVKIALLFDDQADFDADRATLNFLFDAESFDYSVHPRTAVRTARCQAHH